ncbi:MAG: RNA methyltransferase [Proteobacteria bacterium]|nr:RNA methyltransferase [Pseudomonadota bacterium]
MTQTIDLSRIAVILHKPRFSENIGAAARAMQNMGLSRLVVVDHETYDQEKINRMATHAAKDIVNRITCCNTLKEALSPFTFVVGTTARLGGERSVVHTPKVMAERLLGLIRENDIALVFGPEDRGLTNDEIRLCHELVNIPTAQFSSLNLAQAVVILCYEIFNASREVKSEFIPRLASRHELDGMYDQLKELLVRIDYIKPENPDYWMANLRRFFTRIQLRAKDVLILRGLCRQIDWFAKKQFEEGEKAGRQARCNRFHSPWL